MSRFDAEHIYRLLPAVYRLRDAAIAQRFPDPLTPAEHGERDALLQLASRTVAEELRLEHLLARGERRPLRSLLDVIAAEVARVEDDVEQLYENWFIETCEEWVVPYMAQLLGVRGLHDIPIAGFSQRARVANTLTYRRRKGTVAMLEQLARDTTGWPARAVEYFELLGTTQHLNHVRAYNVRTPRLDNAAALARLGTPFETAAHTAEVRNIATERGRYNIKNIGLFLWRLEAYPLRRVEAAVAGSGRFRVSPLGNDYPLYAPEPDRTAPEVTRLAEPHEVPEPLARRPLYDELEARRQAAVEGSTPAPRYFGNEPVWRVYLDGQSLPVPFEETLICDLSVWRDPPPSCTYTRADGASVTVPLRFAFDPALGRIAFPSSATPPALVEVDYHYGFSADVGGGPYERALEMPDNFEFYLVAKTSPTLDTVAKALAQWDTDGKPNAIIHINDSRTYEEVLDIALPAGVTLELRAANGERPLLRLQQPLAVQAETPATPDAPRAGVRLDGLLIAVRGVEIKNGDLGFVHIRHSTLVPGLALDADGNPTTPNQASLRLLGGNARLDVVLERSISGALALGDTGRLTVRDSIVDGLDVVPAMQGPVSVIERSTVFGRTTVEALELGSNSIFTDTLVARRKQQGCARFSHLTPDSDAPRQHQCQPQRAVQLALEANPNLSQAKQGQLAAGVREALKPVFSDRRYGRPAYAQLHALCAPEIRRGADDEAEMGAFNHLRQPQREANLRASLDEYLRVGLQAGVFFAT